jgi:diguanylate cyclase (GGDEF)-like protein/PAS domain S-box-containing protein
MRGKKEALPQQTPVLRASANKHRRSSPLQAQLAAIVEATPDGVAITDLQGSLCYLNPAGRVMLGIEEAEEIVDLSLFDFSPERVRIRVQQEGIPAALRDGQWSGETTLLKRDGEEFPAFQVILTHKAPDGRCSFLSIIMRDISVQKRHEAQLAHLAHHDPLTGLFNRHRFQEELKSRLAQLRRYGTRGAILYLDVDGLKAVNDRLGHQAGDAFLFSLAALLRERLREVDVVARLGGDEFAVLLSPPDTDQAQTVARRLLQAIRQHTAMVAGQPVSCTVSIGIALFPQHGVTVDDILANADLALYQAKANGRDTYCVYMPSLKA